MNPAGEGYGYGWQHVHAITMTGVSGAVIEDEHR
jgi:hypothetical protein